MNILKITCLTVYFLLRYLPLYSSIHYIGLGRDCQVAGALISCNLRAAAYPLDWMDSHHFYGVVKAFQDDFKYFLDPAFLEYKVTCIENNYYHFRYNHFFPLIGHEVAEEMFVAGTIVPNYLDYLPNVQATQNRRIQRLLERVSSKEKIIFIRTHSSPREAKVFMNVMKRKYPQLDVLLVVVHERQDLIGNWNIPNVLNFYASQRSGTADWWTLDEWTNIFKQIQIYLKAI